MKKQIVFFIYAALFTQTQMLRKESQIPELKFYHTSPYFKVKTRVSLCELIEIIMQKASDANT